MKPAIALEDTPSDSKKWLVAGALALGFFIILINYSLSLTSNTVFLKAVSFAFSATSSFLYAMAFSSGSISYFSGWPDMRHGYQKQIGVVAFWFSFLYCLSLLVLYPQTYYYGFVENFWTWDITLGLSAMIIFGAMTVINSKAVAPYFSWDTIKFVLGLGFIGYAILVFRAIFIELDVWINYLATFEGDIPGRLVLSVIAVVVLLLRIAVPIHKSFATVKSPLPDPTLRAGYVEQVKK